MMGMVDSYDEQEEDNDADDHAVVVMMLKQAEKDVFLRPSETMIYVSLRGVLPLLKKMQGTYCILLRTMMIAIV